MKKIIFNVLSVLLGLMMLNSGLNKFFNYIPVPEDLPENLMKDGAAMMEIEWLMPLIAGAEILGGLLIIIPKTRALGVLVLFPVMVGILLNHLFVAPEGLIIPLVLWVILLWIMYENREKYAPIFK